MNKGHVGSFTHLILTDLLMEIKKLWQQENNTSWQVQNTRGHKSIYGERRNRKRRAKHTKDLASPKTSKEDV